MPLELVNEILVSVMRHCTYTRTKDPAKTARPHNDERSNGNDPALLLSFASYIRFGAVPLFVLLFSLLLVHRIGFSMKTERRIRNAERQATARVQRKRLLVRKKLLLLQHVPRLLQLVLASIIREEEAADALLASAVFMPKLMLLHHKPCSQRFYSLSSTVVF